MSIAGKLCYYSRIHFQNIWSVKLFPKTNSNFTPIQQIFYFPADPSAPSALPENIGVVILYFRLLLDYHMQNRDSILCSALQLMNMNCTNDFTFYFKIANNDSLWFFSFCHKFALPSSSSLQELWWGFMESNRLLKEKRMINCSDSIGSDSHFIG